MRHFTLNEARQAGSQGYSRAETVLKEAASRFRSYETYDIFLSHSFSDAELVLGAKKILEDDGYSVYVDWIEDSQLDRENVTKETAQHIKGRMHSCRGLVYATSENSKHSKWMPWELGYFDGHKPGQVSILPLMDSEYADFKGQEYLSLYPVMGKETGSTLGSYSMRKLHVFDGTSTKPYSLQAA